MVSSKRYDTEFVLSLAVIARYHGRQKDLRQAALPPEPKCNLYIVSSAPRVTADPASARLTTSGELFVTLREQVRDSFREHLVHVERFTPDTTGLTWHSEWPHDEFDILDSEGQVFTGGMVSAFFRKIGALPESLRKQEVLYVGQAFGKAGERDAFERLQSHSTLQRIYSEARPDREIWLTLCSIDDIALIMAMDKPGRPSTKTAVENQEHITRVYRRFNSADFSDREGITGAEAALIRYFKPTYNIIYRDNFPDPAHVHISTLYELEIHTLVVELQSFQINLEFGSSSVEPEGLHFAHYRLGSLADIFDFLESSPGRHDDPPD
jgi:hypothetical protein